MTIIKDISFANPYVEKHILFPISVFGQKIKQKKTTKVVISKIKVRGS